MLEQMNNSQQPFGEGDGTDFFFKKYRSMVRF